MNPTEPLAGGPRHVAGGLVDTIVGRYRRRPGLAAQRLGALRYQAGHARSVGDHRVAQQLDASADQFAAALRHMSRCQCCGRRLTDPVSITRGIGPDCAAKHHHPQGTLGETTP